MESLFDKRKKVHLPMLNMKNNVTKTKKRKKNSSFHFLLLSVKTPEFVLQVKALLAILFYFFLHT